MIWTATWIRLARKPGRKDQSALLALLAFQVICAVVFLGDIISDIADLPRVNPSGLIQSGLAPELGACLGLLVGIVFELRLLRAMLRREQDLTRSLSIAAGALSAVIEAYFQDWALTPAERDVATFTIKGFSIAEIATLRRSAEGTVKTHLNAIYRKAGVAGRAQLVSLLVEDLMRAPILGGVPAAGKPADPLARA